MVGHEHQAEIVHLGHLLQQRLHDALVQAAHGLQLVLQAAVVAHLVGGLQVDQGEIVPAGQGFHCGLGLAAVIGVQQARGPGIVRGLQPAQAGDALDQGHRGDHQPLFAVFLLEIVQPAGRARAPEPGAVGRQLALLPAGLIDGVLVQRLKGGPV